MKNNYESMEDMQRMQQEAVRRVREMQKRAKQSLTAGVRYSESNQNNSIDKPIPSAPETEKEKLNAKTELINQLPEEKNQIKSLHHNNHAVKSKNKFDFFSTLLNDHEKSLILVLILLLVDEGADMSLVMALMYLII